jgi:hypothetical protein
MFAPGKLFQPCMMFAGKARTCPNESAFRFSFKALPTNVRLGWKSLSVTNILAYYKKW